VKGNLITRLGIAGGLVAAIVATAFALLVQAVDDFQGATDRSRAAQRVALQAGARAGAPGADAQVRAAALRRGADARARADRAERMADAAVSRAVAISIGGVIGTTVLILLMTSYLTRSIIFPLRRVASAAADMAQGDLSVRVVEEGDAEPVELARSFNEMAANLQRMQAQLEGRNTELLQSERLKDEFFALVSHELRTPLTSIIGYLELVRDDEDELPGDTKRFLEVVDRNAKRLLRLVGDMLFVAQVEAGRLSLERADVQLLTVAQESIEAAGPAAARGQVVLELDAEDVPPIVGDGDRLGQMVDNLVSNALKFTPAGGAVRVTLRDAGDEAVLEVSDQGIGIPDAEQVHLFERFFRSSTAVTKAVPGAGLGLTIVETIVDAHGGQISLTSAEGVGTSVRVTLPYAGVTVGS
jgi:signal transduction histidine kinase